MLRNSCLLALRARNTSCSVHGGSVPGDTVILDAELGPGIEEIRHVIRVPPLNKVQLMVTRKPLSRGQLDRSHALSKTPSWHTDSS